MSSTTCTHNDELIALGAMQVLSAEEQTRLEAQVSACPACRERLREYRALAAAMPQLVRLETAPAQVLNGKPAFGLNGKGPHLPALLEAEAESAEPETLDRSGPEPPIAIRPQRRTPNQRGVKVLSGLAAAIMLLGLIGGFWLLLLSHAPRAPQQPAATPPTAITYNPCTIEAAKGAPDLPPCGLVAMDYTQTPSLLEEIDPTTGQPLAGLKPLQVGNALLASASADRRTLALGILPNENTDPTLLQIVWLDTWRLGAKLQITLTPTESLQDLLMTPDGTGIYVVIDDYGQTPQQATLRYYSYDRAHNALKFGWSAHLPFEPGTGVINDGSFALSADGKTAYIFSAATNPPQLAALPLTANGSGNPNILSLPSIASGVEPPFNDENYTYKPGDPIYTWYQPAVIFAPAQNKLYLVHAEAQNPSKDALLVIDLAKMTAGADIPLKNVGQAGAALHLATQSRSLAMQPKLGVRPDKGRPYTGRSETGAVSPDGRWIYLSGSSSAPQFTSTGSWNGEQGTNLGLLKIDTQTAQIVGRWFTGIDYYTLTFGQDGRNLYLFGPPPNADPTSPDTSDNLLVFDTQDQVVSSFANIQGGWFILTVP
ncbi:MAG TPA: hypothetical protein VKT82_32435 [Ktedonobacterales bacterium]|nr:hypothetical protein [Ktedonobacterales bacterium]